MKLKPGARITGIKPELLFALCVADSCYKLAPANEELVVTEVTGGTHSPGSLHYVGLAADLRLPSTWNLQAMTDRLKEALGADFDVVNNETTPPTHIHIEFQPKIPL
jgi:hypothetical protein